MFPWFGLASSGTASGESVRALAAPHETRVIGRGSVGAKAARAALLLTLRRTLLPVYFLTSLRRSVPRLRGRRLRETQVTADGVTHFTLCNRRA